MTTNGGAAAPPGGAIFCQNLRRRERLSRRAPAIMLRQLLALEERIRTRIHNARFPIKDRRALLAVQCVYFVTPIVLGYALMQAVIPPTERIRHEIEQSPSGRQTHAQLSANQHQRQALQAVLDEVAAKHARESNERS